MWVKSLLNLLSSMPATELPSSSVEFPKVQSLRNVKFRSFHVGDRIFDVEASFPSDPDMPSTYTVDWGMKIKIVGQAPRADQHRDVLLATLDYLEERGSLDLEVATCPTRDIVEI